MKIYVTNLEGTDHRKKWMQNQLDALEIPFQFVQCIDGREWTEEKIKSVVSPKLFEMHQRHKRGSPVELWPLRKHTLK
ncbi:MAG: glycosyltransferase family 25 protein [Flavobacteriales bacterium]|nr:glycosyltransferase family 25 protein [Flavobacteriales bacterium]